MAPRYYTVTWDQLHRDSKALAWRLLEKGPWRGIVAITRGGLIPAEQTNRSGGPMSPESSAAAWVTLAPSATSTVTEGTDPSVSGVRSSTPTVAPSSASLRVVAAPIPEEAPATIAGRRAGGGQAVPAGADL